MPATRPSSDLILHRLSSSDYEIKLKAIREVKNQIIGNRTKKISYIKLGAVPAVADALAQADADNDCGSNLIVQSAAVLGSFACGVDQGVRAVLDAGAFPYLIRLLSAADEKVNSINYRALYFIHFRSFYCFFFPPHLFGKKLVLKMKLQCSEMIGLLIGFDY